jgi:hypothetical protein
MLNHCLARVGARGCLRALLIVAALLAAGCAGPRVKKDVGQKELQLGRGTFRVKQDNVVRAWVSRTTPMGGTAKERWILHDDFATVDKDAPLGKRTLIFEHVNYTEFATWDDFKAWVTGTVAESQYDNGGLKPTGELHNIKYEILP